MTTSVLIVDDSAVSRSIVIRSLPPGWDIVITQASNGSEALAALGEKHHAVVLLDLNMPVMDVEGRKAERSPAVQALRKR